VIQVLANSIIYASEIAIMAVGVALTFSILRFANFAHVQFAVVGGYLAYVLSVGLGLPIVVAAIGSALLTGGLAMLVDALVFRRLRDISPEGKMIVSWGVALFIRSIVAAVFGGAAQTFPVEPPALSLAGAYFTGLDLVCVGSTVGAMLVLHFLLYRTRVGTALRALASNPDLAVTRGIPGERMIGLMWFISGAYAALGGALFALETRLQPNMDLIILLPIFAAVTIGGLSNVFGAVVGALVLSLAQNLLISVDFGSLLSDTSWYVPTQFRDFIAVGALVALLLLRPRSLARQLAR
jgi:branched-subunit amino acid ABC-type transport system permease component